ncbi:hypothetical protein QQF64_010573 [Cirrhinus molitorella]|uniref:Uncharacterized protein n=1 Tax=Cirrhinus molitorella TaxID=172907 RepID=A0ABR3LWS1_9TELE
MQNGSSKTGRGVTVNGTVSTPKRQPRPKTASSRQERGSCSSTSSCPVFCDLDEEPQPRCPSSLSSPSLHRPGSSSNLKGSVSSLHGSLSSLKGSVSSLKSFSTSSTLQSSSSSPSLRSSSSSQRSGSSSENDSWDTNSWSSGATCLLRSTIKQHSEEVFRVRAGSASRPEGTSDSETGYQNSVSESQEGAEQVAAGRRDSSSSQGTSAASTASSDLEQKIEEKLKFSQFLDEVTCRVLDPECLQAFGASVRQKEAPVTCPQTSSLQCLNSAPWFGPSWDSACDSRESNMYKWAKCMPSCKILDAGETLRRTQEELPFREALGRTYLETDIDRVRREDEASSTLPRDVEKRALQSSPVSKRSDGAPPPPYRTTSLPRPAMSAIVVSNP